MSLQEEEQEAIDAIKRLLDGALPSTRPGRLQCYPTCPLLRVPSTEQEAANDPRFDKPSAQDHSAPSHSSDKNGANLFKVAPFFIIFLQMVWRCLIAVYAAPLLGLRAIAALFTQCQTNYHPTALPFVFPVPGLVMVNLIMIVRIIRIIMSGQSHDAARPGHSAGTAA